MSTAVSRIIGAICGLCLAITLFAAGFAACAAQPTTRAFSTLFSDFITSPYAHDQLIDLAVITRDYTVEGISRDDVYTAIANAARTSASDEALGKTSRWSVMATRAGLFDSSVNDSQAAQALAQRDQYGLDAEMLSHLDDCYRLISGVVPWLFGIAVAACALLALLVRKDRHEAARVLIAAPIALGAFMAVCGIWAAIDFNGFFSIFHGVLFPQGNWEFAADSLLICMLPLEFWVSMGALWLAVTLLACIIALTFGKRLKRSASAHTAKD